VKIPHQEITGMRRIRKIVFPGLIIIITACFFSTLPSCRKTPRQNYRKVILYCSVDQVIAEPIIAEFERLTGIDVLPRFDTEASKTVGLVQRIRAEAASPIADVFWSNEIFHTIRLARESLLASYASDATKRVSLRIIRHEFPPATHPGASKTFSTANGKDDSLWLRPNSARPAET